MKKFWIKAKIKLLPSEEGGRNTPIVTGYRPGFVFIDQHQTSGSIELLSSNKLKPGEEQEVFVGFFSDKYLGNIREGIEVSFFEGQRKTGIALVTKIIGIKERPN